VGGEREMKRKLLGITVFLLAVAMLATPLVGMVYAKPSTPVSGVNILTGFTPLDSLPKGKSGNAVSTALLDVTWEGDIAGSTTYEGILMLHNFDPITMLGPDTTINIHERIFFPTVTVLGKTGSLTMEVNFGGSKLEFRWTILSGTGELVNLHGHGTYYLVETPVYAYEGEVHFDS
jgi:hypothetical protein